MEQSADKSLADICEALDALSIENLELIEEKVLLSVRLERELRAGHIELAKARYIRGRESTGMLQVPSEGAEVEPLFDLATSYDDDDADGEVDGPDGGDGGTGAPRTPSFDLSPRRRRLGDDGEEGAGRSPADPIKWFGVLVPRSLRLAQRHFQEALYLSVQLANVQARLGRVARADGSLRTLKEAQVQAA